MCGIVGFYAHDPEQPVFEGALWAMVRAIQNRGPDGQHVWRSNGVGLGHARLSIIDLESRANQPMVDPNTGCVLTYNGEIYNYIELRAELSQKGHAFQTQSDTEVILKAYETWGVDCLNHFNGMWAFALYDPRTQKLFCARDRMGIKPFVYAYDDEKLLFASEAKAILQAFNELAEANLPFAEYFLHTGRFAGCEETFYKHLYNLLPGHYFVVSHGERPSPKRYWNWQPGLPRQTTDDEADIQAQFEALLKDSIKLRYRSDVPVGVCLSGGLDSSSIVALSTQLFKPEDIHTFSCVYPNIPEKDESIYINAVVGAFHPTAHYATPTIDGSTGISSGNGSKNNPDDLVSAIHQTLWEQDGPTGSPAVLSQRAVMQLASQHVKVILDGQGADEILGGYYNYFKPSLQSLLRQARQGVALPTWFDFAQSYAGAKAKMGSNMPRFSALWKASKHPAEFDEVPFSEHSNLPLTTPYPEQDLNTRMYQDLLYSSLPNLLHYEDRNSMTFSIESRLPYLDYRLVEFMFGLPERFKIRRGQTKYLLSSAMKTTLPSLLMKRKTKMGYETPGSQWFRAEASQKILEKYFKKWPSWLEISRTSVEQDPKHILHKLTDYWIRCQQGENLTSGQERQLWRYLSLCVWLDKL